MIAVIDYDRGNLHSVTSSLKRLDIPHVVTDDHDELVKADALILPGVGHFKDAMSSLEKKKLVPLIKKEAQKKPFLGICLGMQLLFDSSEEGAESLDMEEDQDSQEKLKAVGRSDQQKEETVDGFVQGLGLIPGTIRRFEGKDGKTGESYKVPHMGWNSLIFSQPEQPILQGLEADYVYFVHSYLAYPKSEANLLAYADYHGCVPAIVGEGTILGAQFHPEKSGAFGQALLKNFDQLSQSTVRS